MRIWSGKRKKVRNLKEGACFVHGQNVRSFILEHVGVPVETVEVLNHRGYLSLKVKTASETYKVAECESEARALLAEKAIKAVACANGPVPGFISRSGCVIICSWVYGNSCTIADLDTQTRHVLDCQEELYKTALPDQNDMPNTYVHLNSLLDRFSKVAPIVVSRPRIEEIINGFMQRLPEPGAARIIHPDLTPSNIVISDGRPVVIDNEAIAIGTGYEFDIWNAGEAIYGHRDTKRIRRYVDQFHERCPIPSLFEYQSVWDDFRRLRRAMKAIEKKRLFKARRMIKQIGKT